MVFEEFQGQSIFITGAAQAALFMKNGARVFGFDLDETGLQQLKIQYPSQFSYALGSVKNQVEVTNAAEKALSLFQKIDVLLNTAGVLDSFKKTLETDEALWDHILDTNVKGTYFVTNAILPSMLAREKGVIVNMASIVGLVAGGGGAAYTASKHAIIGYTKQLDYDYCRDGIRANAIAPGAIETSMNKADFEGDGEMAKWVAKETPAGRWADPVEVANLTLYIASQAADYMHGIIVPLDGGWLNR